MVRQAKISDIPKIQALIMSFAKDGFMLARPLSELYEEIRDFFVYEDTETHEVIGCVALHICWADLAEVKCLAVAPEYQKKGIGKTLVQQCITESAHIGIHRIFALTYKQKFFEKQGFLVINKEQLPHKIWSECIRCPKFPDCDEIAMAYDVQLPLTTGPLKAPEP